MKRRNDGLGEKGSFLAVAAWGVPLFMIMTAGLVFLAGQEMVVLKREQEAFKAKAGWVTVVSVLVEWIQDDVEAHEDGRHKRWYGDVESEELKQRGLTVRAGDEEAKVNLNFASRVFLDNVFEALKAEGNFRGDKKHYVAEIMKLRYERRIESLEELLLIEDFWPEDVETMRAHVTVHTESVLINVNTAGVLVREAWARSLNGDYGSQTLLMARLREACDREGCSFREEDMGPEHFAELLKLPRNPLMNPVVQAFLAGVTLDSHTFGFNAETVGGAKASGVFRSRSGQIRPEILYWHETL